MLSILAVRKHVTPDQCIRQRERAHVDIFVSICVRCHSQAGTLLLPPPLPLRCARNLKLSSSPDIGLAFPADILSSALVDLHGFLSPVPSCPASVGSTSVQMNV